MNWHRSGFFAHPGSMGAGSAIAGQLMDLQTFCAAQEHKMRTVRRSLEKLGVAQ